MVGCRALVVRRVPGAGYAHEAAWAGRHGRVRRKRRARKAQTRKIGLNISAMGVVMTSGESGMNITHESDAFRPPARIRHPVTTREHDVVRRFAHLSLFASRSTPRHTGPPPGLGERKRRSTVSSRLSIFSPRAQ